MTNRSILITATKDLARSFLSDLICKVEYSANVLERRHNERDMNTRKENGIIPIYNAVDAGYIMSMMH